MSRINVSISYGFGEDNRYKLAQIPESIQLAVYKHNIHLELHDEMLRILKENNIDVRAIHLPLDTLRIDASDALEMIKKMRRDIGCHKFIIHPNKHIKSFLHFFLENDPGDIMLCLENFQWRKGKELKSSLQEIDFIQHLRYEHYYAGDNIRLCFDTTHAEDIWFDYKIMSYLLPYISVIHLSNRNGKNQHMPFNAENGDLNLVAYVKDLVKRYKWSGDIVLEYMGQYHHRLIPNANYLKRLVSE